MILRVTAIQSIIEAKSSVIISHYFTVLFIHYFLFLSLLLNPYGYISVYIFRNTAFHFSNLFSRTKAITQSSLRPKINLDSNWKYKQFLFENL